MGKSHEYLADALRYYGFAVALEVTNGLHKTSRGTKVKQVCNAKRFLSRLNGGAEVKGGIVYIKTSIDAPKKVIDFSLRVPDYDDSLLRKVCETSLDHSRLPAHNKRLLENMLQYCDKGNGAHLKDFINTDRTVFDSYVSDFAKGLSYNNYLRSISHIKGVVLEMYVAKMFDDAIADKRIYTLKQFPIRSRRRKSDKKFSEIDVIIACKKVSFNVALRELKKKYGLTKA